MSEEFTRTTSPARVGDVVRVASGNFIEMYDFIVYGYYASYIAKTFFPAGIAAPTPLLGAQSEDSLAASAFVMLKCQH